MNAEDSTALIVHGSDKQEVAASSSSAVVLDALPYVEALDPNYENYALSLIEEELQHVAAEQQQRQQRQQDGGGGGGGAELAEHPSLRRILPASANLVGRSGAAETEIISASQIPDFGGRAPLAAAAYEALVASRAVEDEGGNSQAASSTPFTIIRPDPMKENGGTTDNMDEDTLLSNLKTSITTSKIALEQERLRLINLELHSQFETPARYTSYASNLENLYCKPTSTAVENQRKQVDGINATRMEEQTSSIRTLDGLSHKWEVLVTKNRRLGRALGELEGDVAHLKQQIIVQNGGGGEGEDVTRGDAMMMEVAEASKES
mmetsp:Transcript_16765/g.28842  ORF Transcript_16765/g.28842 Transcript_16765/m.28842 type:complete len:321 (-) Transcript_16765:375-1337(-)